MNEISLSGSRRFLNFIDDFLRMCGVYFTKQKSKVATIHEVKAMVKNQVHSSIKIIRFDNGIEYIA